MSVSKGAECPECRRVTDVLDSAGAGLIDQFLKEEVKE